jgi:hypothetical protein
MRTAWLALLLLGSISAVAAMLTGTWRSPAAVETAPAEVAVAVEPVADSPPNTPPNWPEAAATPDAAPRPDARQEEAARQAVDPDPAPVLRGSDLPSTPYPAASELNANASTSTNVNVTSRHSHEARSAASAQQIKRIRNSKAEMRAKRLRAANARVCAPPANVFVSLMRKLNLSPGCSSSG